ncbi:MAG: hypothetical protein V1906_03340 [Candidatus Woesearchaeota archaeon]
MKLLKESLKSLKQLMSKPVIYVPDLFMYMVTYCLTVFFYRSSGIDVALQNFVMNGADKVIVFQNFLTTNWFHLLLSFVAFVFVTFILGVGVESIKFRLIKSVVQKKEISFFRTVFTLNPYFFKLIVLKIYVYIITALIFLISATMYVVYMQVDNNNLGILVKMLVIAVALPIVLFFKLGIYYRYAILFLDEDRHASRAFQKSFNLLVDRPKHIIRVWLFSMSFGLLLWIFVSGIGFFARNIQDAISSSTFIYAFSAMVMLMAYLIKLTYDLWENILLFRTYPIIKKSS